jgi:hypothetical protein
MSLRFISRPVPACPSGPRSQEESGDELEAPLKDHATGNGPPCFPSIVGLRTVSVSSGTKGNPMEQGSSGI